jgi:hypothetical protein
MKFHENPSSGSRANRRFSQFCERFVEKKTKSLAAFLLMTPDQGKWAKNLQM